MSVHQALYEALSTGAFEKVFSALNGIFKSAGNDIYAREVILQMNRYNRIKDDENKGIVSSEETRREKNRISAALSDLIKEVSDSAVLPTDFIKPVGANVVNKAIQDVPSNGAYQTPTPYMNRFRIFASLLFLLIVLVVIYAVYTKGGKMTALQNSISYEHANTPITSHQVVDSSLNVILVGRVLLNGRPAYNGEIERVYIKDNPLTQPVTPDGNTFQLKWVAIPESKIIRIAVDLKNGDRLSEMFSLTSYKGRIYNLGECLFTYSPSGLSHTAHSQPTPQPLKSQSEQAERKIIINNPTFNGPTQVGDNNTQINSPRPREVSEALIKEIQARAPSKDSPIHIHRRSEDAESFNYATKIVLVLIKRGYKNSQVDGITYDQIIGGDPVEAARQQKIPSFGLTPCPGGYQLDVTIPANQ